MNIFLCPHSLQETLKNSCIQMGKRKHDFSLDEIVIEFLKRAKYERTLKLFQKQDSNECSKATYAGFIAFLKQSVVVKENKDDDDLGFEINFGAFHRETKVRIAINYNNRESHSYVCMLLAN